MTQAKPRDLSLCPSCGSDSVHKMGLTRSGCQRYQCKTCFRNFRDKPKRSSGMPMPTPVTASGLLGAAEWVYYNMLLKGTDLRKALLNAPKGSATLLHQCEEDPQFRRSFLNTWIPRLFAHESKQQEEEGKKRESKFLFQEIDKMLENAVRESQKTVKLQR